MTLPTSEYSFKRIFLLLLLGISLSFFCEAQVEEQPLKKKEKKQWEPITLSGIRVGTELLHLVENIFGTDRAGFEINADVGINNKFFLVADFGYEDYTRMDASNSYKYNSKGQYFRIGLDYNLLHKKTSDEGISFGLRYANANFNHNLTYTTTDPDWGEYTGFDQESGLSGNWVEFVTSFKVRILKNLYLSPNFRIKFLSGTKGDSIITIADIPGYGVAKSTTRASANYSLLYRLPIGKNN